MKKLKELVDKFLYEEEDESTSQPAEEVSPMEKPLITITPISPQELAEEISPVSDMTKAPANPVNMPVEPASAPKPTYLNVQSDQPNLVITETQRENIQQLIAEISAPKKPAYQPRPVISPIFGNQNAQPANRNNNVKKKYETDFSTQSVIGTVFSPISGKDLVRVVKEDTVNEKIASMSTSDFVDEVPLEKPILNVYKDTPSFSRPKVEEPKPVLQQQPEADEPVNEQISLF